MKRSHALFCTFLLAFSLAKKSCRPTGQQNPTLPETGSPADAVTTSVTNAESAGYTADSTGQIIDEFPAESVSAFSHSKPDRPAADDSAQNGSPSANPSAASTAYQVSADIISDGTSVVPPLPDRDPNSIIDLTTAQYTYEKMTADLNWFAASYPQYVSLEAAKTTADGRLIHVVYFGNRNAARQIFLCAATHGREYMTTQLVMKQLEYYCANYNTGSYNSIPYNRIFENTCFVLVPMVNPDGVTISQLGEAGLNRQDLRENLHSIYSSDINGGFTTLDYETWLTRWKANGVGVDLNRNYSPGWTLINDRPVPSSSLYKGSSPGSEAEAAALMSVIDSLSNPLLAVSYHSYGNLIYWQYGQAEPLWTANSNLATHISNLTGYPTAGYSNEAGFSNWCVIERGIPSVTVETGGVPCPLPLDQFSDLWARNQHLWAMLATVY